MSNILYIYIGTRLHPKPKFYLDAAEAKKGSDRVEIFFFFIGIMTRTQIFTLNVHFCLQKLHILNPIAVAVC